MYRRLCKYLQILWIPSGRTWAMITTLDQGCRPVTAVKTFFPGHACHSLLILAIWIHPSPHFTYVKAFTETNYSTGHLLSTLLWVWVGSIHKRTIQGLQTSPHTAPVPRAACLLSTWRGRGFIMNTWSHCGLKKKKKMGTRWSTQHAYPVTLRWACPYALCISNSRGKNTYWSGSVLINIWVFIQCQHSKYMFSTDQPGAQLRGLSEYLGKDYKYKKGETC